MEVDQIEADRLPSPTTTNSGGTVEADYRFEFHRPTNNNQTGSHQKRRRLESPPPINDVQADRRPLKRARGLVVQDQGGDHETAPENRGVARVPVSDGGVLVESWHQRWLRHALPWVRWFFFQIKRVQWFFPALRSLPVRTHIHFVGLGAPGRMIG